jgi:hypothetical protein
LGQTTLTGTGLSQLSIIRRQVGIILQVTPKITLDGRVVLRIIPEVSKVIEPPVLIATGTFSNAIAIQHMETTVVAEDGSTVVLGGVISRDEEINDNKVPWLGDLPHIGPLFRFRTRNAQKKELLIILTPHIIRTREDTDRILAQEGGKMSWKLPNVLHTQGWSGMDPVLPAPSLAPPIVPPGMSPPGLSPPGLCPGAPPDAQPALPPGSPQPAPPPRLFSPPALPQVLPEATSPRQETRLMAPQD